MTEDSHWQTRITELNWPTALCDMMTVCHDYNNRDLRQLNTITWKRGNSVATAKFRSSKFHSPRKTVRPSNVNMMLTTHTHTHTYLTALCQELPRWASTRKVKLIWILLKRETVSGSGISWAICKSAPRSRQITMPAPHHSVFYRPDALPAAQTTASKSTVNSISA